MGNSFGKSLRESARDTRHGGTRREGKAHLGWALGALQVDRRWVMGRQA